MTETDFDFTGSEGGAAAEAAAKSGGKFSKTGYFKLDGSPQGIAAGNHVAIIRLLNEHIRRPDGDPRAHAVTSAYGVPWITVDMHSMVPTKPQPADWPEGRNWPKSMGAVCRNDKVFRARYGDCYICTTKKVVKGKEVQFPAGPRTWALAVLREEVVGTAEMVAQGMIPQTMVGTVVGYRDKTKEVAKMVDGKDSGEVEIVPEIVIIQQAWKNFWSSLSGMAARYTTCMDRDYHITRSGNDTTTTYQIVPLDPIVLGENNKYGLPAGTKYDMSIPELVQALYPDLPDLRPMVAENADDDYYARFFDPSKVSPPIKKEGDDAAAPAAGAAAPAGPANVPNAPSAEPTGDALAALRARVTQQTGAAPADAAAATPPAAEAAPAAEAPATEAAPAAPAAAGAGLAL